MSIYYSHDDDVLKLSELVNVGAQRLGQDGPFDRDDATLFPPAEYRMVDATGFRDYAVNFLTSHQYYRSSPTARSAIAIDMAS